MSRQMNCLHPIPLRIVSVLAFLVLAGLQLFANNKALKDDIGFTLVGKTFVSKAILACKAKPEGYEADRPTHTLVFPDGTITYRVEFGFLRQDVGEQAITRRINTGTSLRVSSIKMKDDYLELKFESLNGSESAKVKLMLGKGWQASMNAAAVVQFLSKLLPIDAGQATAALESPSPRSAMPQTERRDTNMAHDTKIADLISQAEGGDAGVQYRLGTMYENGQGVPKNEVESVRWLRKAAEQGYARAESDLGWMYFNGHGVSKDLPEAVRWWRKAAEQGYSKAQYNLGFMYENGEAVPKDAREATLWYHRAAEQGDTDAQVRVAAIAEQTSPVASGQSELGGIAEENGQNASSPLETTTPQSPAYAAPAQQAAPASSGNVGVSFWFYLGLGMAGFLVIAKLIKGTDRDASWSGNEPNEDADSKNSFKSAGENGDTDSNWAYGEDVASAFDRARREFGDIIEDALPDSDIKTRDWFVHFCLKTINLIAAEDSGLMRADAELALQIMKRLWPEKIPQHSCVNDEFMELLRRFNSIDKFALIVPLKALKEYDHEYGTHNAEELAELLRRFILIDVVGQLHPDSAASLMMAAELNSMIGTVLDGGSESSSGAGTGDAGSEGNAYKAANTNCKACVRFYEVLDLPFGALNDEVKAKKRAFAEVLHPDQLGSKSERARHVAEEQLKKINEACDHILQCRFSRSSSQSAGM